MKNKIKAMILAILSLIMVMNTTFADLVVPGPRDPIVKKEPVISSAIPYVMVTVGVIILVAFGILIYNQKKEKK